MNAHGMHNPPIDNNATCVSSPNNPNGSNASKHRIADTTTKNAATNSKASPILSFFISFSFFIMILFLVILVNNLVEEAFLGDNASRLLFARKFYCGFPVRELTNIMVFVPVLVINFVHKAIIFLS